MRSRHVDSPALDPEPPDGLFYFEDYLYDEDQGGTPSSSHNLATIIESHQCHFVRANTFFVVVMNSLLGGKH